MFEVKLEKIITRGHETLYVEQCKHLRDGICASSLNLSCSSGLMHFYKDGRIIAFGERDLNSDFLNPSFSVYDINGSNGLYNGRYEHGKDILGDFILVQFQVEK